MGLLWIFSYLPNEFLRPRYGSLGHGSKLLLCLYFMTAMGFGCQLMSMFEGTGSGVQWKLLFKVTLGAQAGLALLTRPEGHVEGVVRSHLGLDNGMLRVQFGVTLGWIMEC